MGWSRRVGAWALLVVLAPVLASCSRATPLCDYAGGLVKATELAGAADAYATAQEAGEGDCAADGLDHVAELRAGAGAYVAKGRAAARAGKTAAATASFRAALSIDRSDDAAAAEMQRLTRVAPTPAPAVSTVVVAGPVPRRSGGGPAWVALSVAVLAVAACAATWLLSRRRIAAASADAAAASAAASAAVFSAQQDARTQVAAARDELTAILDGRLDRLVATLDGRVARVEEQAADAWQEASALADVAHALMASLRQLRDDTAPRIEEHYVPQPREER